MNELKWIKTIKNDLVQAKHSINPSSLSPSAWLQGSEKKMNCWGDFKSSFHRYLSGEAYYVSCQKRLSKIKYDFEGSVSDVDLGSTPDSSQ